MQQDKKLVALAILGFLAVASLLYGILTPSKVRRGLSSGPSGVPSPLATGGSSPLFQERQAARTTFRDWGRNPFVAKGTTVTGSTRLVLNGIAWDEKNPRAVINDQIVGPGDQLGGNIILEIRPDRVILSDGSEQFELRLSRNP